MKITLDIDLERFRYALVGDGYIKEEVIKMSEETLINIFKRRVLDHIDVEYDRSWRFGLLD